MTSYKKTVNKNKQSILPGTKGKQFKVSLRFHNAGSMFSLFSIYFCIICAQFNFFEIKFLPAAVSSKLSL